ncbi:hypothetical protein MRS44_007892 [Fusarium solani]|uniref:uncharacterized protein n=1 Tax=Fusarium solani TaxID=169388 RepID=UPI0032C3FE85|nr:hypothetical protein MRS44_007892 [Fusarium solani]
MGSGYVSTSKRKVSRTETNPASLDRGRSGISHRIKTRSKGQGKARHCKRRRLHFQKFYHEPGLVGRHVGTKGRGAHRISVPLQRMAKRAEAPWGPCAQMQDSAATKAKLLSSGHWGPLKVKGGHGGRLGKGSPRGTERVENPVRRKDNVSRESSSSIFLAAAQNRARSGSLAS